MSLLSGSRALGFLHFDKDAVFTGAKATEIG